VELDAVQRDAIAVLEQALVQSDLTVERPTPNAFLVAIPGEHRLSTPCAFLVGAHTVSVNAFVARKPDENHAEVYRLLLQRNTRLSGVAFALDRLGDIYLVGRMPTATITADDVDSVLGAIAEASDSIFDRILVTGFASSIRREWSWRQERGQPLDNLEPFRTLLHLGDETVTNEIEADEA
jgi:hypothetical protein